MEWIVWTLLLLVVLGLLAAIVPPVFGVALAGLAPLFLVLFVIGIGAIWWRHSRRRIDPEVDDEGLKAED